MQSPCAIVQRHLPSKTISKATATKRRSLSCDSLSCSSMILDSTLKQQRLASLLLLSCTWLAQCFVAGSSSPLSNINAGTTQHLSAYSMCGGKITCAHYGQQACMDAVYQDTQCPFGYSCQRKVCILGLSLEGCAIAAAVLATYRVRRTLPSHQCMNSQ